MFQKNPDDVIRTAVLSRIAKGRADEGYPKKGSYKPRGQKNGAKEKPEKCWVLGECTVFGKTYYRVVIDGHSMKISADCISVKEEA